MLSRQQFLLDIVARAKEIATLVQVCKSVDLTGLFGGDIKDLGSEAFL